MIIKFILTFIQNLVNLLSEKSDLDLLSEERRIEILEYDLLMQNIYEWFILVLVFLIGVWVLSKILLNLAERQKIKGEVEMQEKGAPGAFQLKDFDRSELTTPSDPTTGETKL